MQQQSVLDRFALKCESSASFYLSNQEHLYRLLINCSILTYSIWIAWELLVSLQSYNIFIDVPKVAAWIAVYVALHLVLIVFAFAVRSRITSKKSTGLTLAAVFLFINLITLHFILFIFGLYAFLNTSFRNSVQDWAPLWYRNLTKSLN